MRRVAIFSATLILALLAAVAVSADIGEVEMPFQGNLAGSDGNPVEDGDYSMTFRLYDDATSGSQLWTESQTATLTGGMFTVRLGSITPIPVDVFSLAIGELYLETEVEGETLSPRTSLGHTPFSAVTQRLAGDVSTGPGELWVSDTLDPESGIQLSADENGGRMVIRPQVDDTAVVLDEDALTFQVSVSGKAAANRWVAYSDAGMYATDTTGDTVVNIGVDGAVTFGGPVQSGHTLTLDGPTERLLTSTGEMYLGRDPSTGDFGDVNVGIGTTSPEAGLHIRRDADGSIGLTIENQSDGASSGEHIHFVDDDGYCAINVRDEGHPTQPSQMVFINNRGSASGMEWIVDGLPRLTLTSEKLTVDNIDAYGFTMPTGASNGYVLTSDAGGVGSWQEVSGNGDGGGWVDDGSVVRLETAGDEIAIGTATPSGDHKVTVAGGSSLGGMQVSTTRGGGVTQYHAALWAYNGSGTDGVGVYGSSGTTGRAGYFSNGSSLEALTGFNSGSGVAVKAQQQGTGIAFEGYGKGTLLSLASLEPSYNERFKVDNSGNVTTDGSVGIGTDVPDVPLHVASGGDLGETGGGRLLLGSPTGSGLRIDQNEIQAYTSGTATDAMLYLQREGTGGVTLGANDLVVFETGEVTIGGYYPQEHALLSLVRADPAYTQAWLGAKDSLYEDPDCLGTVYGYYGVWGRAWFDGCTHDKKYGVTGQAWGNGINYGVYGSASGGNTNWAGYFSGDVRVTGTLDDSKSSIIMDHPLDPGEKYLHHSSVNSPDMMNVYNGNVVLDNDGQAVIALPDYFEALNGDFRYQLTCIGGFAPVYVAEEISDNRFKIAGGESGMKISWQVTGIRKDAFAEANRIQVEVEKPADERGKYLHPEAFGLGEETGIGYEERQRMTKEQAERREIR